MPLQSLSLRCLANPRVRTAIGVVRQRLSVTIGLRGAVIGIMYVIFTHVVMGFPNTRLPTPQSHLTVLTLHILFLLSICYRTSNPTKSAPRYTSHGFVSVESGFFATKTIASIIPLVPLRPRTTTPPLSISSPRSSMAGYFVGTVVSEEVLACRIELRSSTLLASRWVTSLGSFTRRSRSRARRSLSCLLCYLRRSVTSPRA